MNDRNHELMQAMEAQTARPLQVLVVDDVSVNRELMCLLVEHYGHVAQEAADGVETVERVAAGGIDLVLLDIELSGISGLEAARRIRRLPAGLSLTPMWAVSAHAFPDDVAAALEAGMNGHLSKPVILDALQAVLQQAGQHRQH
jgi:CheY-like chemotaxis protein